MPQFTQLNLQSKPDSKSQPKPAAFIGKQTLALFAGAALAITLVGGLLLETSGCSRENDTAVAIQHPITSPITSAPTPVQEAPAAATPTPVARKVHKRRPTTALYADKNSGITFRYPKRYTLKPADSTKSDAARQSAMNFVQPGGVDIVTVELPKNSYPHTDLASASFHVSVNPTLTAEQCGQFALLQPASTDKPAILPAKVRLAGLDLQTVEAVSGSELSQSDARYYHAFANGACYEFSLNLSTEAKIEDADTKHTEDEVAPVDRTQVFRRLRNLLATVKIEPVAAAKATTPAATPETTTPASDVAAK
ncbi:MAG: hypothetical protein ACRD3L_00425 [Terriglobales bacterium]